MGAAGDPQGLQRDAVHQGPQPNDEHHPTGHHIHPSGNQPRQVLEGPARDLCDAEAGGRIHQLVALQAAQAHRGPFSAEMDTAAEAAAAGAEETEERMNGNGEEEKRIDVKYVLSKSISDPT